MYIYARFDQIFIKYFPRLLSNIFSSDKAKFM